MERKNPANILFSGAGEQGFERARRTQLDIDIFGARKKTQEQLLALLPGEIIGAAFPRIARGDDDWRAQLVDLAFQLIDDCAEVIESKLKEVRRLGHRNGEPEIGRRGDDTYDLRRHFLDRLACVIMSGALEGDSCGNESCSRVLYIEGAIFSSSEPSIVRCGTCQHPLDVFGQNVELYVH